VFAIDIYSDVMRSNLIYCPGVIETKELVSPCIEKLKLTPLLMAESV